MKPEFLEAAERIADSIGIPVEELLRRNDAERAIAEEMDDMREECDDDPCECDKTHDGYEHWDTDIL